MEAKAQTRYVRVTAQKARRVVNLVRGKNASEAIASLRFQPRRQPSAAARLISAGRVRKAEKSKKDMGASPEG